MTKLSNMAVRDTEVSGKLEGISRCPASKMLPGATRTLAIALVAVVFSGIPASAGGLGKCGSTWKQKLGLPEYLCFDLSGNAYPYAHCAVGVVAGYKPVYFGTACDQHDSCYARRGAIKSQCDGEFRALLEDTCDYTLDGKFRGKSRKACRRSAALAESLLADRGCDAFKKAQSAAGNRSANCD